jgi:hypothetical protein
VNPFAAGWLVLDGVALLGALRLGRAGAPARKALGVMLALQLGALVTTVVGATADSLLDWLIWLSIVLVNAALAVAGLRVGNRFLSVLGLLTTAAAVVLLRLGSFSSIAVAEVAAVLLLGGALLPRR